MKALVIKKIELFCNDRMYRVGQEIEIFKIKNFYCYATLVTPTLIDWIPRDRIQILRSVVL